MTALRSDEFNGASGAFDSTWTQQRTAGTVNRDGSGNAVASVTASHLFAFDNTKSYPNNQYSKVKTGTLVAGDCYNEPSTRASLTGDANYQNYYVQLNINKAEIIKIVAGVHTSLLDNPAAGTAGGSVGELRSRDDVHEMFVDGVSVGSANDSAIASGSAGVGLYDEVGGSTTTIVSWEGGDFTNPAPRLGSLMLRGDSGRIVQMGAKGPVLVGNYIVPAVIIVAAAAAAAFRRTLHPFGAGKGKRTRNR